MFAFLFMLVLLSPVLYAIGKVCEAMSPLCCCCCR